MTRVSIAGLFDDLFTLGTDPTAAVRGHGLPPEAVSGLLKHLATHRVTVTTTRIVTGENRIEVKTVIDMEPRGAEKVNAKP